MASGFGTRQVICRRPPRWRVYKKAIHPLPFAYSKSIYALRVCYNIYVDGIRLGLLKFADISHGQTIEFRGCASCEYFAHVFRWSCQIHWCFARIIGTQMLLYNKHINNMQHLCGRHNTRLWFKGSVYYTIGRTVLLCSYEIHPLDENARRLSVFDHLFLRSMAQFW